MAEVAEVERGGAAEEEVASDMRAVGVAEVAVAQGVVELDRLPRGRASSVTASQRTLSREGHRVACWNLPWKTRTGHF